MKNLYVAALTLTGLLLGSLCHGQKTYRLVQDTLRHELQMIETNGSNASARITAHDIQVSVSPDAVRPESTINMHLNIGQSVDIESMFTIVVSVKPPCVAPCNVNTVANSWLSTKAINKIQRTVDFTIGGLLAKKEYVLQIAVFGLDGDPCTGSELEWVTFRTVAASVPKPSKMLLVIDEQWRNTGSVQTALNQYKADVLASDPLISIEKYYMSDNNSARLALYRYIQQEYRDNNLSYLFFIGGNASTTAYRRRYDHDGNLSATFVSFTFTHYTLPLYESYFYDPSDDNFKNEMYQDLCFRPSQEKRQTVFQQQNSTISMGMIIPDIDYSFERKTAYMLTYFQKLHKFKNKEISFSKKVLISDGFVSEKAVIDLALANGAWSSATALSVGHDKDPVFSEDDPIWKADYLDRLGMDSYEIFTFTLHGSPNYHSFGIYKSDINNLPNLNTQIISMSSCNVGTYNVPGYLAGQYLEKGNLLNVHAYSDLLFIITFHGESALEKEFEKDGVFTLMSKGHNISDAYRFAQSYGESEVILGDPLVKLQDASPLPVVLQAFAIAREEMASRLSWTTVSEINSEKFEIERSQDGIRWDRIGMVLSSSQNSGRHDYTFMDNQPLSGANLYRLKMIDLDGTYAYSQIRRLRFETIEHAVLYPNPVTDKVYFSSSSLPSIKSLRILSGLGKNVLQTSDISKDGVAIDHLPAGLYTMHLMKGDGTEQTQKIIVVR